MSAQPFYDVTDPLVSHGMVLKAALDYAQSPENGGFWVAVCLGDGSTLVGTVSDHRYANRCELHIYDKCCSRETGKVRFINGLEVEEVWLLGDIDDRFARWRNPVPVKNSIWRAHYDSRSASEALEHYLRSEGVIS